MNERRTTNILLLIIVIPLIFYLLKILSFILIPLVSSLFIALLFLPLMRWLTKRKIPNFISIIIILLIFIGAFLIGGEIIKLASKEIVQTQDAFLVKAQAKITDLAHLIEDFLGVQYIKEGNLINTFINNNAFGSSFGSTLSLISNTITMLLMTAFFVVLWLAESINFYKILSSTIFKRKYASAKIFMKIEDDLIKFVKVKFFISALTGIGFGLACYFFNVSFPIFWGLVAFLLNFVQMIGSIVSVILLSIFAFVELDPTSVLFFFILTITLVQVVFGSILEPIFLGKSFSINVIAILVSLMLWGYIWGVPGLIMSIPITVFLKIIFEQFPQTKFFSSLLSGKH
ncbi:AI-2E family transporter [Lutibacter flavus]|uniref:Predicted PurR-regulated permease PerM n=1 Tax=Lutibacter flavus TaxID=691689 RepID=A0A238W0L7_9FLAO|nr:AI-2E family transporter [Lutibacter flavus]SNR39683.1 Predicted PurR-regulated permease PerM [Lutibacter flavus]